MSRSKRILKKLNLEKLPFKFKFEDQLNKFSSHIIKDLKLSFEEINHTEGTKWCFSTIKKAKVFLVVFEASEIGEKIYKEEIAKRLSEYSYKTIATIIDEGLSKGVFVSLEPKIKKIKDKKIKNIRPSEEVTAAFINWNISRISSAHNIFKKYR